MELIRTIIIPIVSAMIGGLFTFLGVLITIKHEQKKEMEERILSNKPLFYRLDPMQEYDHKKACHFYFGERNYNESMVRIFGVIKNTDKAILIINHILINDKIYKPLYGDVVDKNQIIHLFINVLEKVKNDNPMILSVRDIMGNEYEYLLETTNEKNKGKDKVIIGIKEIKS